AMMDANGAERRDIDDYVIMMPTNAAAVKWKALKELQTNKEIIIKPSDKGGGVVIQSRDQYMKEIYRQLDDQSTYKELKSDPIGQIKKEYASLLGRGRVLGILNRDEFQYLDSVIGRTPVFYTLPKIHKSEENPPGRPIVSGVGSLLSNLSEYIDKQLQPLVVVQPSYLRDSMSLLSALSKTEK
ncbi:Hypothetical predicted protein, partial [Pelobates cultripes]